MDHKSISGARNIIGVITLLAFSPEALSIYSISKALGLSRGTVKRVIDALLEARHIVRVDDNKYTVNPDYIYVYDGVAIYKYSDEFYMMLLPGYDDLSDEALFKKFTEIKNSLPASVRLWIDMEPIPYDDNKHHQSS